jgi:hypothetical protein
MTLVGYSLQHGFARGGGCGNEPCPGLHAGAWRMGGITSAPQRIFRVRTGASPL